MIQELEVNIKEIIPRTYNVKSFRVEVAGEINFKAGQFLSVTLKKENGLMHYLSISSSPTEKSYIEFTKKLTESEFSKTLNRLTIGDAIWIKYPMGNFTLNEGDSKIAFISGGIGITPIRSICKYALDKKLGIDMVLIYANHSEKDIAFKDDFDIMQKEYSKLKVVHLLCESPEDLKCRMGLVNGKIIQEEIPDYAQRKFYLCGPPAMVAASQKILLDELGKTSEHIVTENFMGY